VRSRAIQGPGKAPRLPRGLNILDREEREICLFNSALHLFNGAPCIYPIGRSFNSALCIYPIACSFSGARGRRTSGRARSRAPSTAASSSTSGTRRVTAPPAPPGGRLRVQLCALGAKSIPPGGVDRLWYNGGLTGFGQIGGTTGGGAPVPADRGAALQVRKDARGRRQAGAACMTPT
jgi:hypothetical protein